MYKTDLSGPKFLSLLWRFFLLCPYNSGSLLREVPLYVMTVLLEYLTDYSTVLAACQKAHAWRVVSNKLKIS